MIRKLLCRWGLHKWGKESFDNIRGDIYCHTIRFQQCERCCSGRMTFYDDNKQEDEQDKDSN